MSARTEKKLRRLTRGEVAKVLPQLLPATAARTVLEMKKFAFGQRLRFAWWLLFGEGEWKGFKPTCALCGCTPLPQKMFDDNYYCMKHMPSQVRVQK